MKPAYLEQLNTEQYEAVITTTGPLLVLAGAGTGKTKTLTTRIAHLIATGTAPERILAVTFTNKAAAEMLERVRHMVGDIPRMPIMKTFHSLGVMILRSWHERVGLGKQFAILDTDDQVAQMKIIMEAEGVNGKEWDAREIVRRMSALRLQSGGNLESVETSSARDDIVVSCWRRYRDSKRKQSVVDFDDLIEIPVKLLHDNADIRAYYHTAFEYIHVDEYQDTSDNQYQLISMLLGSHKNLCVVGDGDQTIYTWRGATMRNIMQFQQDYPGATMVALTRNYRSTQTILDAANAVIAKNVHRIPKDLSTDVGWGAKIVQYQAYDENDEASWVANRIMELQVSDDISLSQVGILYRSHYQSRAIEEALLHNSIPYSISGVKFFDRKEIKDVLAYVRCALVPGNIIDFKRVCETPKRGIGKVAFAHIAAGTAEALSGKALEGYKTVRRILVDIQQYSLTHCPSEVMMFAIEKSGIQAELARDTTDKDNVERIGNIRELVTFASRFDGIADSHEESLSVMMEQISLLSETDSSARGENEREKVHMLTIHSAKGLEFDTVFMVGLEEGLFPSDMGMNDGTRDTEEERRLMYVALTRARKNLHISHAMTRRVYGQVKFQTSSSFLMDIPSHLVEVRGDQPKTQYRAGDTLPSSLLDW
jgi:DNA helicase-2/ATP-dependent DNA helicase PcrA